MGMVDTNIKEWRWVKVLGSNIEKKKNKEEVILCGWG
jgi:hypothetical protein